MNKISWISEMVTVRCWPVILLEVMWNDPCHETGPSLYALTQSSRVLPLRPAMIGHDQDEPATLGGQGSKIWIDGALDA